MYNEGYPKNTSEVGARKKGDGAYQWFVPDVFHSSTIVAEAIVTQRIVVHLLAKDVKPAIVGDTTLSRGLAIIHRNLSVIIFLYSPYGMFEPVEECIQSPVF